MLWFGNTIYTFQISSHQPQLYGASRDALSAVQTLLSLGVSGSRIIVVNAKQEWPIADVAVLEHVLAQMAAAGVQVQSELTLTGWSAYEVWHDNWKVLISLTSTGLRAVTTRSRRRTSRTVLASASPLHAMRSCLWGRPRRTWTRSKPSTAARWCSTAGLSSTTASAPTTRLFLRFVA